MIDNNNRVDFFGLILNALDLRNIVLVEDIKYHITADNIEYIVNQALINPDSLFMTEHITEEFLANLTVMVDDAVFVVLFSVGDPKVFDQLLENGNKYIGVNKLACIRVGNEWTGIIYKDGLTFTNFRILLDTYNGRDPGEKILTVDFNGVLIVMIKMYNRKITKKYMRGLNKIVKKMHGSDKPVYTFVSCKDCKFSRW